MSRVLPPVGLCSAPLINTELRLTHSQAFALQWLRERNGDGCFDLHGLLRAGGDTAPIMRATWNTLELAGLVEFYGGGDRLRLTLLGKTAELIDAQ